MITHQQISQRAREIWEREGRPQGRDIEHWLQAETELRQESLKGQNRQRITSDTAADSSMLKMPGLHKEDPARKRTARRAR
jgi:hypothetical protein